MTTSDPIATYGLGFDAALPCPVHHDADHHAVHKARWAAYFAAGEPPGKEPRGAIYACTCDDPPACADPTHGTTRSMVGPQPWCTVCDRNHLGTTEMRLPTSEGHWWVKIGGSWDVVKVHEPTGDGLEVADRGPVWQFACDGWGPKVAPYVEPPPGSSLPTISLHRFYFVAIALTARNGWRYGQAMFNHLLDVWPALAERIRGTDADPFHCGSPTDPRFDRFVEIVEAAWGRSGVTVRLPGDIRAIQVNAEISTGEGT